MTREPATRLRYRHYFLLRLAGAHLLLVICYLLAPQRANHMTSSKPGRHRGQAERR